MVRSSVQVCVRTRPTSNFTDSINVEPETKAVNIHLPKDKALGHINNQQQDWSFKFDNILHNASQETTYDVAAADVVQNVLDGYNGTILAYGQTGAGKTFTMTGTAQSYKYRGIVPRAIAHIYREIADKPETAVVVRVSYLEIYNETLYDLLAGEDGQQEELNVMDDAKGQVSIKGLHRVVAQTEEEALNLLFEGETNRQISAHQMNSQSSRSHTIFTIYLEMRSRVESSERVVTSKLNLVDLAGSERVGKTGSSGAILKEAQYINKSLSFLEQVVIALSDKNRDHVPFRQSKLTNVLRDSLGGNCKTRMIANIWAEREHLEETISTLKFATRMMKVSNEATLNVIVDPLMLIKKYEREIRELKQELAMHDALANRGSVQYDSFTTEQQFEMQQLVRSYVSGSVDDIEVINLRQIKEVFKQFKIFCQNLEHDVAQRGGGVSASASAAASSSAADKVDVKGAVGGDDSSGMVGDLDEASSGFHLGVAASNARPAPSSDSDSGPSVKSALSPIKGSSSQSSSFSSSSDSSAAASSASASAPDEGVAFEDFKQTAGAEVAQAYQDNRTELKKKKADFRSLSLRVNEVKREIDELSAKLDDKRASRRSSAQGSSDAAEAEVIDEEEYALIRDVKAKKKLYQQVFHDRKILQNEVSYLKGLVSQTKVTLCNNFLEWYQAKYSVAASSSSLASISMSMMDADELFDAKEVSSVAASSPAAKKASKSLAAVAVHGADQDELDDGERFERLERERIMNEDPESIAFYNARKAAMAKAKTVKTATKGPAASTGRGR